MNQYSVYPINKTVHFIKISRTLCAVTLDGIRVKVA